MSSTKLCILGCGGFIGSHVLDKVLADPAYTVFGIDTNSDKIRHHLSNSQLHFKQADIYTDDTVSGFVDSSEVVISLAALCNPSLYNTVPVRVIENNFSQPSALVAMCAKRKKWLIHFSTCEVYGRTITGYAGGDAAHNPEPFIEDSSPYVLGPIGAQRWTYACAKQLLERLIYAYGFEQGLEYTIVRPFNFIGPRMDFIPGIDGEGVPRVIACFMEALLFNKPLKLVDGGGNRRAFTAISDAVDAVMAMIKNPEKAKGQVFNIGNPRNEITIADLARRMKSVYREMSVDGAIAESDIVDVSSEEFYGKGYDDSDRRVPDISKARRLLGWEPRVGLDDALSLTIASYIKEYKKRVPCGKRT